jgi:hypothetical protein
MGGRGQDFHIDGNHRCADQKARGKRIYVYSAKNMCLVHPVHRCNATMDGVGGKVVNNDAFSSIREASKYLPISISTLVKKVDSDIPFKGYLYYSKRK